MDGPQVERDNARRKSERFLSLVMLPYNIVLHLSSQKCYFPFTQVTHSHPHTAAFSIRTLHTVKSEEIAEGNKRIQKEGIRIICNKKCIARFISDEIFFIATVKKKVV